MSTASATHAGDDTLLAWRAERLLARAPGGVCQNKLVVVLLGNIDYKLNLDSLIDGGTIQT
jgi:hypothetical protein